MEKREPRFLFGSKARERKSERAGNRCLAALAPAFAFEGSPAGPHVEYLAARNLRRVLIARVPFKNLPRRDQPVDFASDVKSRSIPVRIMG